LELLPSDLASFGTETALMVEDGELFSWLNEDALPVDEPPVTICEVRKQDRKTNFGKELEYNILSDSLA
jgi:hypothetical protein